jgi:hypothetical protein
MADLSAHPLVVWMPVSIVKTIIIRGTITTTIKDGE